MVNACAASRKFKKRREARAKTRRRKILRCDKPRRDLDAAGVKHARSNDNKF